MNDHDDDGHLPGSSTFHGLHATRVEASDDTQIVAPNEVLSKQAVAEDDEQPP